MTPTEALENLAKFLHGKPALQVATVARGVKADDPPDTRALNLAGDAKQHFQTAIATSVTANIDPLQWSLKKYDPVYKPEQGGVEVEWVKTVDVASMGLALDRVKNLGSLAGFDPSDQGYLKRLAYWAGVLTNADASDAAYFFRSFTASAELKRKSKAALVLKAGTFHLVEERIFLFDEAIDCFVYGEYIFVVRKSDFRRIFDQMQQVFEHAKRAAADLHGKLPISNFQDFQNACASDSRLADKVLSVRKRDYFDELSYPMVEPVIDEFGLDVPITESNGKVELEFRTAPEHRFRILRLVDDDYLRSAMTKHRYEVNSKTDPPRST
jgi:hypothetical protein